MNLHKRNEQIEEVGRVCNFLRNNGYTNVVHSISYLDDTVRVVFDGVIEKEKSNAFREAFPMVPVGFSFKGVINLEELKQP